MELEAAKRPINWIGSGLLAKNLFEAIDGFDCNQGSLLSDSSQTSDILQVPTGKHHDRSQVGVLSSRRNASCCPGTVLTLVSDLA